MKTDKRNKKLTEKEVKAFVDDYYTFLRKETAIQTYTNGWSLIVTPYVSFYNDCIELFISRRNGNIEIADCCTTLQALELKGVNIYGCADCEQRFSQILENYGVSKRFNELYSTASISNINNKIHNMNMCILDMGTLRKCKWITEKNNEEKRCK